MKKLSNRTTQSPAEDAKDNLKPEQENSGAQKCFGAKNEAEPQKYFPEHHLVQSRLGGKAREISFGPLPGGLVPKNPFASRLQAKFAHANPSKFGGESGLKEWDTSTDFKKIPKRAKK